MTLSKNIKHYRRCVPLTVRHYTGSSNAVERSKMTTKTMALTQWKILNILKEYLNKITNDKSLHNVINKEIVQLLQKFQPSVYGNELVKFIESNSQTSQPATKPKFDTKQNQQEGLPMIGTVWSGLTKLRMGKEETVSTKEIVPKWKVESSISKNSIMSRTKQLINSLATMQTEEGKLRSVEELSLHVQQYPEAKASAGKEGAIRVLLHIRNKTQNQNLIGAINEVFALLGHTDPLPAKGIRILSMDGGGVRGILVIEMLKKLEELTGKRVHEMFDFICGVSTGAILACTLGVLKYDCKELHRDYIDISTQIFTQSAIKGTSNLVWSHAYYNTELWEKLLKRQLGEGSLISTARIPDCPKITTVSAVVNHERVSAYVFRNYCLPWRVRSQYMGGCNHKVWEAARASAAAPTYFEECKLGNLLHQDGGILVNNPTAVAIHEAKLLWPNSEIQCVVSFGTGRTVPNPCDESDESASASSWKTKFMKILDSATDTEGVHTMLSDLLPDNKYFRFNPYLTEMHGMAEIVPAKLEQLERDALMYLRRNEDKFQQAAKALTQQRPYTQKVSDYLNLQCELLGISSKL